MTDPGTSPGTPAVVLVTGSAGFVGRHLVRLLRDAHIEVIGVDFETDIQSDHSLVHDLRSGPPELPRFDACVHLASSVGGILFNLRDELLEDNRMIDRSVIEACRRAGCERLVFVSSINVFEASATYQHGRLERRDQVTPYARSKAASEELLDLSFPHVVVVRPTNIFGADQRRRHSRIGESHVIPDLLAKIDAGGPVTVLGDGTQVRNFVHVRDVCRFLRDCLRHDGHHWFNVRSDLTISIAQLVRDLAAWRGRPHIDVRYDPEFMRHERFRIVNFDLALPRRYGWRSTIDSIAEGLEH